MVFLPNSASKEKTMSEQEAIDKAFGRGPSFGSGLAQSINARPPFSVSNALAMIADRLDILCARTGNVRDRLNGPQAQAPEAGMTQAGNGSLEELANKIDRRLSMLESNVNTIDNSI